METNGWRFSLIDGMQTHRHWTVIAEKSQEGEEEWAGQGDEQGTQYPEDGGGGEMHVYKALLVYVAC